MKQQVIARFRRSQAALDPEILDEAVNGFGMNQHQIPRFVAELERRVRRARSWGLAFGTVFGVIGVALLTLLAFAVLYLAGAM